MKDGAGAPEGVEESTTMTSVMGTGGAGVAVV
jgi:hypothetical protein